MNLGHGTSGSRGDWVLITGSSTGIGRACALHLARRGFNVFAAVRQPVVGEALQLEATGSLGELRGIVLDVTRADSIAAAAVTIDSIVGGRGLRGLVNNAGIGVHGPVEYITLDQWRFQFEVNLFGQIGVTQAFLPLLRRYGVPGGASSRIIMIGSIAGRISQPILAPYCASKHALEAVSDALRLELADQRVGVSLIEPGAIKSEIWRKGLEWGDSVIPDATARRLYGRLFDAVIKLAANAEAGALGAEVVARAVERCLTAACPPTRVLIGRDAWLGARLRQFLPDRWFDRLLRRMLGIR